MDVIELLTQGHEKVQELLQSLGSSLRQPTARRAALLAAIHDGLVAHVDVAGDVLYPSVFQTAPSDAARKCVVAAEAQQRLMRSLLVGLMGMDPDDPKADEALATLRQSVMRHVAHEEEQLFPLAKRQLSAADLDELGVRALACKRRGPASDPAPRRRATDHGPGRRRRAAIRVVTLPPAVRPGRPGSRGTQKKRRR
jgi:hypothetical protein